MGEPAHKPTTVSSGWWWSSSLQDCVIVAVCDVEKQASETQKIEDPATTNIQLISRKTVNCASRPFSLVVPFPFLPRGFLHQIQDVSEQQRASESSTRPPERAASFRLSSHFISHCLIDSQCDEGPRGSWCSWMWKTVVGGLWWKSNDASYILLHEIWRTERESSFLLNINQEFWDITQQEADVLTHTLTMC